MKPDIRCNPKTDTPYFSSSTLKRPHSLPLPFSLSFTLSLCRGVCFAGEDLPPGNRAVFLSG